MSTTGTNNEDNTGDILLGIKSPFNHLPVPEQPATYPSIISTNNMNIEINSLNNMPEDVDNKPLTPDESFNKEGQPVFDQERLNSQLNLIDDLSLDQLQKIYDQTGNIYYRYAPLNTLTPIQHQIIGEISRIFTEFGAQSDLLSIIGSWGDTLPEDQILQMFKEYKVSVPESVPCEGIALLAGPIDVFTQSLLDEHNRPKTFKEDLTSLINRHSLENGSNTPDFILAEYLCGCLEQYESTVSAVKFWNAPTDPAHE